VVDYLLAGVIAWLAARIDDALAALVEVLRATAFTTPDLTVLPQVREIWSQNTAIVNTAYVLAIVAAGAVAMTHESLQVRYSVKDLAPRLVFGAVAGNFSLHWCSMLFDTANALTRAVTAQPVVGPGAAQVVADQVHAALGGPNPTLPGTGPVPVLQVVVALLIVALLWMLMFTWIVRVGVLLVLTVTAPAALACHCLPQTDPVARLWWRTLAGTLGVQVLQAVTLHTGLRVFFDPDANLPAMFGLGAGAVLNLAVLAALLWTCVKIPP
jgi:hypothetical protein